MSYIIRVIFPTIRQVELIEKKKFAIAAFDPEHEVFIIHIVAVSINLGDKIYPSKTA